jgi:hypothetical protein
MLMALLECACHNELGELIGTRKLLSLYEMQFNGPSSDVHAQQEYRQEPVLSSKPCLSEQSTESTGLDNVIDLDILSSAETLQTRLIH